MLTKTEQRPGGGVCIHRYHSHSIADPAHPPQKKPCKTTCKYANFFFFLGGVVTVISGKQNQYLMPYTYFFLFPSDYCFLSFSVSKVEKRWRKYTTSGCALYTAGGFIDVWQSPSPWWYPPEIHEGFALLTASQGGKMRGWAIERGRKCETKYIERWIENVYFLYIYGYKSFVLMENKHISYVSVRMWVLFRSFQASLARLAKQKTAHALRGIYRPRTIPIYTQLEYRV